MHIQPNKSILKHKKPKQQQQNRAKERYTDQQS